MEDETINSKKIDFIICTNDEIYMKECRFYIDSLYIPEGYSVGIIEVTDAKSMTEGYNRAMHASDAKYKIYIHQDCFIIYRNFLADLLQAFSRNDKLGLVGVVGTKHLEKDELIWDSLNAGGCISVGTFAEYGSLCVKRDVKLTREKVEFLDGMLIATSYDRDWNERIEGFHFYDVSRCLDAMQDGYEMEVLPQEDYYLFHDFGPLNLETYNKNHVKFCNVYPEFKHDSEIYSDDTTIYSMSETIADALMKLWDQRSMDRVEALIKEVDNAIFMNQTLLDAYFFLEIEKIETITGVPLHTHLLQKDMEFDELRERFLKLRFLMFRIYFGYASIDELCMWLKNGSCSIIPIIILVLHALPYDDYDFQIELGRKMETEGALRDGEWRRNLEFVNDFESRNMPKL